MEVGRIGIYETPLLGGVVIAVDGTFQLIYYRSGSFAGYVVGWSQQWMNGRLINQWEAVNFGTPVETAEIFPGLRSQLLAVL